MHQHYHCNPYDRREIPFLARLPHYISLVAAIADTQSLSSLALGAWRMKELVGVKIVKANLCYTVSAVLIEYKPF